MSCNICGAGSHKAKDCTSEKNPNKGKKKVVTEEKVSGRGLTVGNSGDLSDLDVCIAKCDHDALYDDGAKSLVGGDKGKPSGLKAKSTRVDRQMKGNVQFQKGGVSLAKVTFTNDHTPQEIFNGLRLSLHTGKNVKLPAPVTP